jgi:hypothetical protein
MFSYHLTFLFAETMIPFTVAGRLQSRWSKRRLSRARGSMAKRINVSDSLVRDLTEQFRGLVWNFEEQQWNDNGCHRTPMHSGVPAYLGEERWRNNGDRVCGKKYW